MEGGEEIMNETGVEIQLKHPVLQKFSMFEYPLTHNILDLVNNLRTEIHRRTEMAAELTNSKNPQGTEAENTKIQSEFYELFNGHTHYVTNPEGNLLSQIHTEFGDVMPHERPDQLLQAMKVLLVTCWKGMNSIERARFPTLRYPMKKLSSVVGYPVEIKTLLQNMKLEPIKRPLS